MMPMYSSIIRRNSRPMEPQQTGIEPRIRRFTGIKAFLFDVYGTLVISASGDLSAASSARQANAFAGALASMQIALRCDGRTGAAKLREVINRHYTAARVRGTPYPEIDILHSWRDTLDQLHRAGLTDDPTDVDLGRLAAEYESRVNPIWPMPHAAESLRELGRAGLRLGVISNAQYFTPELFPAIFHASLDELGCPQELQFFSFRYGRAKPDAFLFRRARRSLEQIDIWPKETLYVGNDMLNDISPASKVGFRTALFAGDTRSLRLRQGDRRVAGIRPDLIVTHMSQLIACVDGAC